MAARQEGAGEPSAEPQSIEIVGADFVQAEPWEWVESYAPRQTFGALLQQAGRCTPQYQEARRSPWAVCQDTKDWKEVGTALNLIQHHGATQILQRQSGFVQLSEITGILEVEKSAWFFRRTQELSSKGSFAHLSSAQ